MRRYTVVCEFCEASISFEDADICIEPFPHVGCPCCGHWIPLF